MPIPLEAQNDPTPHIHEHVVIMLSGLQARVMTVMLEVCEHVVSMTPHGIVLWWVAGFRGWEGKP